MAKEAVAEKNEEVELHEELQEVVEEPKEAEAKEEEKPEAEAEEVAQEEPNESEELARAKGWRPKEEWEGDPKKWVDADEFNRRGELFEKIENQGRELKETKRVLRMLQEHHSKVKETEYQRAIDALKAQKKQALLDGDADAVLEADERIMDMKAEQKVAEKSQEQNARQPDPRFVAWVEKNPWYAQDSEMRTFADDVGIAHAKAFPNKTPDEVLAYVNQRVRKVYPEKFQNPLRSKPSPTGGRTGEAKVTRSDDFELSAEEKRAMNTFVSEGIMTKEQYIADIKALRGK